MYGTGYSGGGSAACGTYLGQVTGCGAIYELSPPSTSGGSWNRECAIRVHKTQAMGPTHLMRSLSTRAAPCMGPLKEARMVTALFSSCRRLHSGRCVDAECPSRLQRRALRRQLSDWKVGFDNSGNLFGATVAGGVAATSLFLRLRNDSSSWCRHRRRRLLDGTVDP